jgi:hypothetical protein
MPLLALCGRKRRSRNARSTPKLSLPPLHSRTIFRSVFSMPAGAHRLPRGTVQTSAQAAAMSAQRAVRVEAIVPTTPTTPPSLDASKPVHSGSKNAAAPATRIARQTVQWSSSRRCTLLCSISPHRSSSSQDASNSAAQASKRMEAATSQVGKLMLSLRDATLYKHQDFKID